MRKPILDLISSLKTELLQFPLIVDRLEKKEPDFLEELLNWIKRTEGLFIQHSISEASLLAGIRGRILASRFDDSRRTRSKKNQIRIAADSLYELQNVVLSVLKPYENKIDEAKDLIKYLLKTVEQVGAIEFGPQDDFQSLVEKVWNLFQSHDQLKAGAVKIKASLSRADILRIIAEEIDPGAFMSKPAT